MRVCLRANLPDDSDNQTRLSGPDVGFVLQVCQQRNPPTDSDNQTRLSGPDVGFVLLVCRRANLPNDSDSQKWLQLPDVGILMQVFPQQNPPDVYDVWRGRRPRLSDSSCRFVAERTYRPIPTARTRPRSRMSESSCGFVAGRTSRPISTTSRTHGSQKGAADGDATRAACQDKRLDALTRSAVDWGGDSYHLTLTSRPLPRRHRAPAARPRWRSTPRR